jgi:hypothetical protein
MKPLLVPLAVDRGADDVDSEAGSSYPYDTVTTSSRASFVEPAIS